MIRPDERQLDELLCEVESVVDRLRHGSADPNRDGKRWSLTAFQLLARARLRTRDGFPASNGGRGSGASKKGGDYGGGVVPSLALAPDTNEDRKHWDNLLLDLQVAMTYLRRLPAHIEKATPAHQHPDRAEDGCRVCSRPGKPEPIYRAERCEWCYRFWLLWKADAPPAILKLRREGKRITEQAIRLELNEELAG